MAYGVHKLINWEDYFTYSESSPTGLRNKFDRYGGKNKKSIVAKEGDVAGYVASNGYGHVTVDYKGYLSHRVIWEMYNGNIPPRKFIDHIDGNPGNNSLSNLRLVESSGNGRNKLPRDGRLTGVRATIYRGSIQSWSAYWKEKDKKQEIVYFSVKSLGFEKAFESAVEKRLEMVKYLNSIGEDYSLRHNMCLGYPHAMLTHASSSERESVVKILEKYNLIDWN